MHSLKTALILLLTLFFGWNSAIAQGSYARLAPFEGVRWVEDNGHLRTEIVFDGQWCELVELDGLAPDEILTFCQQTWPGKAYKRFGEDLVEAMSLMKHAPGATVELVTRDLKSGQESTHKAVAMTSENRQAVLLRNRAGIAAPASAPRVPLAPLPDVVAKPDPRYAYLAEIKSAHPTAGGRIRVEAARHDLLQLEAAMAERYSYWTMTGVDQRAAFDALHYGLAQGEDALPASEFALSIRKLMALFGDGHSRGLSLRSVARPGYAPYLLKRAEQGVVAFREDRSALLHDDYPYLLAIDGRPIDTWLEAAKPLDALGAPHYQDHGAIANLRYLAQLRTELGRRDSEEVVLTLGNEQGRKKKLTVELRQDRAPVYGTWPRTADRRLDGDIGYLRIESMDSSAAFVRRLDEQMQAFADTRGLIIDVRGNGGGARTALLTLMPYFLPADAAPVVVNVAAYRLLPGQDSEVTEYLSNRFLWPLAWEGWSEAEREAIESFAANFQPDWSLPEGFTDWHYMLVAPKTNPRAQPYEQPVVVLMDTGCFSATDIFLGGLAELDAVTLMGTPSGGGSGRTQSIVLANSGQKIRLSSMASFRPNGARYDGKGIEVDVQAPGLPTDWIGDGDSRLDAAMDFLNEAGER